jgi:hypothetical protein
LSNHALNFPYFWPRAAEYCKTGNKSKIFVIDTDERFSPSLFKATVPPE